MSLTLLTASLALAGLFLARLATVACSRPCAPPASSPPTLCVVLGSGGHTAEMVQSIRALPARAWLAARPFYVVSESDTHSAAVAEGLENDLYGRDCRVVRIPRARNVGQSYLTSILTTFIAVISALRIITRMRPHVVLANGPGVCVPVFFAALLVAALVPGYGRPSLVYMESFTCVRHLSLTGKLLLPLCDVFTVQWPGLHEQLHSGNRRVNLTAPVGEYRNELGEAGELAAPKKMTSSTALVTVGSTKFVGLMQAIDCPEFLDGLRARGIRELIVQQGQSAFSFRHLPLPGGVECATANMTAGVSVRIVVYEPNLGDVIRRCALVISHAGAGTILEALEAHTPLIVVPNHALMSDHQADLATALERLGYLLCFRAEELAARVSQLNLGGLRRFPGVNRAAIAEALSSVLPNQC